MSIPDIEPDAAEQFRGLDGVHPVLLSVAISLKRIADNLDRTLETVDYHARPVSVADSLMRMADK